MIICVLNNIFFLHMLFMGTRIQKYSLNKKLFRFFKGKNFIKKIYKFFKKFFISRELLYPPCTKILNINLY